MKAYLIDPRVCVIREIHFTDDKTMLADMRRVVGADTLDQAVISEMRDSIWVDGDGLRAGKPICAFKLPIQKDPFAGKAIVIGADAIGCTRAPAIPIEVLRRDLEWLGEIVPEVTFEETPNGARAIVTYSRAKSK